MPHGNDSTALLTRCWQHLHQAPKATLVGQVSRRLCTQQAIADAATSIDMFGRIWMTEDKSSIVSAAQAGDNHQDTRQRMAG
jgi:hypothetical protein